MREYYFAKDFNGHNQNWSVVQDCSAIMYFANTDGFILQYDGIRWRKILINNESIVRSLAITNGGLIFVGAQDEAGFLEADYKGNLAYNSLVKANRQLNPKIW